MIPFDYPIQIEWIRLNWIGLDLPLNLNLSLNLKQNKTTPSNQYLLFEIETEIETQIQTKAQLKLEI